MCWIAIADGYMLPSILKKQIDRGTDWLGYIYFDKNGRTNYHKVLIPDGIGKEYHEMLKKIIIEYKTYYTLWVIHHRKASLWHVSFDNVHPMTGDKYLVIQNGTNKEMHRMWILDFLIGEDESDTAALQHYLSRHCKNIREVPNMLAHIFNTIGGIGTVIVIDASGHICFFSDWTRETDINITENNFHNIQNYWTYKRGTKNVGYVLLNHKKEIIEQKWKVRNDAFVQTHYASVSPAPLAKDRLWW